jgi:hypothetical protein
MPLVFSPAARLRNVRRGLVRTVAVLFVMVLLGQGRPAWALLFNLTDGSQLSDLQNSNSALYNEVRKGFNTAASLWSSVFSNNVTINITINFASLGSGILGQTGTSSMSTSYSSVRAALVSSANPLSSIDQTVVANLPTGNPVYTVRNSGVTVSSANVGSTRANMKALGILGASALQDGSVTFSSDFAFDFDRSDGIDGDKYDFIGVAAHEIGHALGIVSAVDNIDNGSTSVTPRVIDLFRYSSSGVRDLSADTVDKYFSVNGGIGDANGGSIDLFFSEGVNRGDGNQASHWRDHSGLGIMDPSAGNGELLVISENDLLLFDAIGWNRVAALAVPEPPAILLLLLGACCGAVNLRCLRRVRRAV